ncbi:MAG: hypothetical protein A3H98_01445 [Bacteroidetes bacterium RIFCSPLOWO2_02_FULL_36_8]|nr:MAG: hypothetical protein A3H98_01445 [Bacteroidetes bacterium RIFCSPLOWO2_02_FULL_36_8]
MFTVTLTATGDGGTDSETKNNLITVQPAISATAGSNTSICTGSSVTLNVSVSGGNGGPYTYSWTPSTGLSATNTANPNASPSATTTYMVYVSDGCSPMVSDDVTVTVTPPITASATANPTIICQGMSASLSANATGGSGGAFTYSWVASSGSVDNPLLPLTSTSPLFTTTYIVYVSDGGCSPTATANVVVSVNPPLTVIAGTNVSLCEGEITNLSASVTGGNGGPYSYSWVPSVGLNSNTIQNPIAAPSVTTNYSLFVSDGCSQPGSDDVTVTVNNFPTAPLVNCGATTLSSIEYVWNPSIGADGYEISFDGGTVWKNVGNTFVYDTTGLSPGETLSLMVRGISFGLCSPGIASTKTCSAINCAPLSVIVSSDTTVCKNSTVEIGVLSVTGGTGNYFFNWSDSLGTTQGPYTINIFQPTAFTVSVGDSGAITCGTLENKISIGVYPNQAGFTYSMTGDTILFNPDNTFGSSFVWNFGDGNVDSSLSTIAHVYDTNGVYNVCVQSVTPAGCVEEFCDSVEFVKVGIAKSYTNNDVHFKLIPNPGKEQFQLQLSCCGNVTPNEIQVFNLQGQEVLHIKPQRDGKFTLGNLMQGLYFLKIKYDHNNVNLEDWMPVMVQE